MIGCLAIIWWLDRYNREPIPLVALVFGWGAVFAVLGSFFINSLGNALLAIAAGSENASILSTMFLAPLVEEPMKALVLVAVAQTRWFENTTDGFVYGAAAGLGFAMTENFLYFQAFADEGFAEWVYVVVIRTACSGLMHAIATSVVGAAIGWARCRTRDIRFISLLMGLATAVVIHGVWNTLIVMEYYIGGQAILWDIAIFVVEFVVVFGVFLIGIEDEQRMMVRELMEEAEGGVLPPQHVHIIASVKRRRSVGWCPPNVNQADYVEIATQLAFKRMQCRGHGPEHADFYDEARALRHQLREMLGTRPLPPTDEL